MSHTINPQTGHGLLFISVTIVDYTLGGEAFTAAELGVSSVLGAVLGSVPATQNSLGVPLFPVLAGGKVMLFRFVSGAPAEVPTTAGLNAVVPAVLMVT